MLKALELHGFKSFADKTRFEFPDGITVVVGPNGSGKSNVVDAIRWVLGEQSAKSLRGSEMSDVIFKGAGNSQRKPANAAEVTIVFDNELGRLDVESPEVRVTRRVYRSGEGEYLINAEPCRLKDIRDLFRGTGVGTDAYSLIEQGKVDTLLQASPRERRAIFEEAAGISRFKAKKVESQRRLDRVEQNLLRLSDIVEEVERRLKTLRNQATKARRYREYTERLKELRTHVGLTDFRSISASWQQVESKLTDARARLQDLEAKGQVADGELAEYDQRMTEVQASTRRLVAEQARTREFITSHEARVQLQHANLSELVAEASSCRHKMVDLRGQADDAQGQLAGAVETLSREEQELVALQAEASQADLALNQLQEEIDSRSSQLNAQRMEHQGQRQASGQLKLQLHKLESQLIVATDAIDREQQREAEIAQSLERAEEQSREAEAEERQLQSRLEEALHEQAGAQLNVNQQLQQVEQLREEQSRCETQVAAATERANVLEEVERRAEGIGAGTKDLLAQASAQPSGALSEVCGMVADLIEVKVEMAPLIDAALGERAQFVVVSGGRLLRSLSDGSMRLRGRVGLIPLQTLPRTPLTDHSLAQESAVLGRATDFLQVAAPWKDLADHLLGTTWLVRTLDDAMALRQRYPKSSCRYVTAAGEVMEADGIVFGGPRLSSGGIVSRRSELRALRAQITKLNEERQMLQLKLKESIEQHRESERALLEWTKTQKHANDAYAQVHAKAEAARQLVSQYRTSRQSLEHDLTTLQRQHDELSERQTEALQGLSDLETLVTGLEQTLRARQTELTDTERERKEVEQAAHRRNVELAKFEQRVESLRLSKLRYEQDNDLRAKAVAELQQQLASCLTKQRQTEREILHATSKIAEAYLLQEQDEQQIQALREDETDIDSARRARLAALKTAAREMEGLRSSSHTLEMQSGELRMKRDAVAERLRDDYGIELSEIEDELDDQGERQAIEQEIAELRRKISNIGAVNMESLAELDDLEERFGSLSTQYNDLIAAKESLERIIQRINIDSRKMFMDTLETIRVGFQSLFQRAFGGGVADIVVESDVDVLDAGIDIVATPPGKHSLSISLLSGGERALTAVTLLLAIFRHRPSPFCILDEVDGPLDEANIGRFVDVLREFLDSTKVVIVTHSKKTMSAATTLYGVTMQESGVSKRVSVQFNDVREDGSIRSDRARDEGSNDEEAA